MKHTFIHYEMYIILQTVKCSFFYTYRAVVGGIRYTFSDRLITGCSSHSQ